MPGVKRTVWSIPLAAALVVSGCSLFRPGDPDGQHEGARPLELGAVAHDSLKSDEGDWADWYAIQVDRKGPVSIQLEPDTGPAWNVEVELLVYDEKGTVLENVRTQGKPELSVRPELAPGKYYIAVGAATAGNVVPYTLVAREEKRAPAAASPAAKPPPRPAVETRRGTVLEISDHGHAVLLDVGKSQGIEVGQKGRLLAGGATVGSLEIVEVYPEGSLAKLSGDAVAPANSTAEIDVPAAR